MVHRCKCGNCVLAFVVNPGECPCCLCELCKEKLLEENMHDQHLTLVVFEYPLEISRLLYTPTPLTILMQ